ncbi:protein transporter tim10 [Exophiala xenobiotica]|uniref:Mitochondrial import inner membrane translocase subunit n=1 Tax=Lithohypha guttulata TaxID=1690604 RepID=A0ABR0KMI9_9EURO|nr:protein transporter tim10 [Lithohypha guttulata]KAK5328217.1 protein transporter tim10 [Exophiala xenobiotica]
MSFLFGGGRPQLTSAQKIEAAETELELVSDMFNREGDLNKAESVCIDRCVAKFFEVNMKVSEKMQSEAAGKQGGGGMGGGMFGM